MTKTLVLLSGGLKSAVLLKHMLDRGGEVTAIGFDYGQRHAVELQAAGHIAARYDVPFEVVELGTVGHLLTGSALTDPGVDVPDGHYEHESMHAVTVPGRNAIMVMIGAGVAKARGLDQVAIAVHAGGHAVHVDTRPEFVHAASRLATMCTADPIPGSSGWRVGGEGAHAVAVVAPFVHWSKAEIVARGRDIGVAMGLTWSCYRGDLHPGFGTGPQHCGTCGACTERREAFDLAGVVDPTNYYPAVTA